MVSLSWCGRFAEHDSYSSNGLRLPVLQDLQGLAITVPAGAGATAYQYSLPCATKAKADGGWQAGTTSTGNATLARNNTAWTSSASEPPTPLQLPVVRQLTLRRVAWFC